MRHCDARVAKILIGLHEVGIVGLHEALKEAEESNLGEREEILDRLMDRLSAENYIPESQADGYRTAVWREFLRRRGEDFRDFYSEVEVVVRGEPGEERDRFVATLTSVFGDFELKPVVAYAPPTGDEVTPELVVRDHTIVQGNLPRRAFREAVRRSLSHW